MSVVLLDSPNTGTRTDTNQNPTQLDRPTHAEELPTSLKTSRRQLRALTRQNDKLLEIRSLLTDRVSSLELALAKANQCAHYDVLTGLPNRRLLLQRFIQAAALADRNRQVLAVLFFDLNDFKHVNDKLGHDAGDKLLQQVATRLSSAIRKSDTMCRYGGDEFVGLLSDIDRRMDAVTALKMIRAKLALPYVIDRYSVRLTVSDGLAIYPNDAKIFTDLMQLADRLMFRNKCCDERQSDSVPTTSISLHDAEKKSCVGR